MQEGDIQVLGTLARFLVNQTDTLLADFSKCVGNTIFYAEGYMMYTFVTLVKPLLNGTLRRCRLQQFQFYLTTLQEGGLYFLILYRFNGITLQTQHVFEVRQALFNALDSNAQMFNV